MKTKSIRFEQSTPIHFILSVRKDFSETMAKQIKHRPSCSLHFTRRLFYILVFFLLRFFFILGRTIAWKFFTVKSAFNLLYYFSLIDIKLLKLYSSFDYNYRLFLCRCVYFLFLFSFSFALPNFAIL